MIPTCEEEAEIFLLCSILIIIIILIEYIIILYEDCMQFPSPIVEQKFNN